MKALESFVSWWYWEKGLREGGKGQLKLSPSKRGLWALKEANTGRWTDKQIGAGCLLPICPYLCIVLPIRNSQLCCTNIMHIFCVASVRVIYLG